MNLGLGVERLAMIAYNSNDVRQLCYPQFFPRSISDREIARAVHLREEPVSVEGKMLAAAITRVASENGTAQGPCSFDVWEGTLMVAGVKVVVEETESNARLCGPACANEIFVHEGSSLVFRMPKNGNRCGQRESRREYPYVSAVSALAAARIEEAARCGKSTGTGQDGKTPQ